MSKYQISMVSSICTAYKDKFMCTAYKDKFMCTAYKDKFMKRKGFPVITIFTDQEKFLQVYDFCIFFKFTIYSCLYKFHLSIWI